MDLKAFLKPEVLPVREETVVLSERFKNEEGPVGFILRGISEEENAAIRRSCQKRSDAQGVSQTLGAPVLDRERYIRKFTAACVVYPDLKDRALQESWGVMGEEALLGRMLTAGEFAGLFAAAQRVCGFLSAGEAERVKAALKKDWKKETGS